MTDDSPKAATHHEGDDIESRERVIGSVMRRIEQRVEQRNEQRVAEPPTLAEAIRHMARPVLITSALAASISLVTLRSERGSPAPTPAGELSTARALGFPADLIRWTAERERQPQLFELITSASLARP